MKAIKIPLLLIVVLLLGACASPSAAPMQPTTEEQNIPQVVTPSEMIVIAPTSITEDMTSPTITSPPLSTTSAPEEMLENPLPATPPTTITIIYDNNAFDPRLATAWGFSALIEYHDYTLLFDTGGDGRLLMDNMRILGIDPMQIDSVVLSHAHDDHTGGLITLLNTGIKPTVYLLPSFPSVLKHQIEQLTPVSEVSPGDAIAEGFWTTGELGTAIPEQALVLKTEQGLVVITGCAHPGIVEILEQARAMFSDPIHLVLGGFHLGSKSAAEVIAILSDFRRLGVVQVAPTHCTGELAIARFADEYGDDFIQVGVGSVIIIGNQDG